MESEDEDDRQHNPALPLRYVKKKKITKER
jgi:hypothetical protein